MPQTRTFTADNLTKTPITVQSYAKRIRVREDPSVANWPTQGFTVFAPLTTSPGTKVNPGEIAEFEVPSALPPGTYLINQVIGYITTDTSATTFAQWES